MKEEYKEKTGKHSSETGSESFISLVCAFFCRLVILKFGFYRRKPERSQTYESTCWIEWRS